MDPGVAFQDLPELTQVEEMLVHVHTDGCTGLSYNLRLPRLLSPRRLGVGRT